MCDVHFFDSSLYSSVLIKKINCKVFSDFRFFDRIRTLVIATNRIETSVCFISGGQCTSSNCSPWMPASFT